MGGLIGGEMIDTNGRNQLMIYILLSFQEGGGWFMILHEVSYRRERKLLQV